MFLETGLGKTYISILLIKHLFGEQTEINCNSKITYKKETNKKVIFLFKTISLLLQQSQVLKYNTKLKVLRLYGGQDGNNTPPYGKFRGILEKYDIICATPETIYRYFTFGYINVDDICLIVLDECHHTKDKDFYNLILKHFIHPFPEANIRILGLTASPSFDNEKSEEKITENIQNLCNNMNCYLACPSNIIKDAPYMENETSTDSLNSITTSTAEKEIHFIHLDKFKNELSSRSQEIKLFLFKEIMAPFLSHYMKIKETISFHFSNENFEPLIYSSLLLTLLCDEDKIAEKQIGIFEKDDYELLKKYFEEFGLSSICKAFLEKFQIEADKFDIDKINFSREMRDFQKKTQDDAIFIEMRKYSQNINLILKYIDLDALIAYSEFLFKDMKEYFVHSLKKQDDIISQCKVKLEQLKKMVMYKSVYLFALENFYDDVIKDIEINGLTTPKSIVFVNQRIIAKLLNDKMSNYLRNKGYNCRYVLGCQSSSSVPFSEEELKQSIENFTNNPKCIILFATNVVEEGIDVPQCNYVINLSEIKSIKEYIQKTGRARKSDSKIFLCCLSSEEANYRDKIEQIKISIKVMKKIIMENKLEPKVKKEKFISGLNYYESGNGARVYLSYAKKMIEEFIGKLFYDGYTYLRSSFKIDEIVDKSGKTTYRPYLSLPYVLESSFSRIYDSDEIVFSNKEEAKTYYSKYEDYYFLKAVRMLHMNHYFNDHLLFAKNYDDLMVVENNCSKFPSEPTLKIKINENDNSNIDNNITISKCNSDEYVELIAHILSVTPNYIDINYDNDNLNSQQVIAIISETPLTLINFDLYVHSTVLLKLYYFNTAFDESEENKNRFAKKPKIPYNIFTKLNVLVDRYQPIKIYKKDLPYINFLYSYLLFSSTDAELFFYYSIYTKKFDFAEILFNDKKTINYLQYIFEKYGETIENRKKHLSGLKDSILGFSNHSIKFSILNKSENGQLSFDMNYIKGLVNMVKEEIEAYYFFLLYCVEGEENIKRMLKDEKFLDEKENKLTDKRGNYPTPKCGVISRNLVNFSKMFIMNFGQTDLRGTTIYKDKVTYQMHFLEKYGILTDRYRDYRKCLPLDYNQKILKYKVNINQVGKVTRHFHKIHYMKKFNFLPNEVLHQINHITIDQLHMFTLFPVMLFKIQNSLIYYYQAYCLRKRFPSFNSLPEVDIRLLTQALNSRSTLECENYERLEFLGDAVLKFLSSFEVFKQYPEGNRDLLYSKRRIIENNKSLYKFAIDEKNSMHQYLFTSPVTIKRVKIPGFNKDETLVFNIGYNRSFSKHCFFNRQNEKKIDQEEIEFNGVNINQFKFDPFEDVENEDKKLIKNFKDEEKTEKTPININYDQNEEPSYTSNELIVGDNLINDVVNNKIEISYPKTFRILYNKVLADLIESLTGFLLHSVIKTERKIYDMFNQSSNFLKELGIIQNNFQEMISDPFWLKNLLNENCKFKNEQKMHKVKSIIVIGKYTFKNIELLYQAVTHSSYMSEESMKANFPYVKKSYQRLAFLGEAFISFYVSLWVYEKNANYSENMLHKLKICGINHHIISLIAINLKLDDCLLQK